MIFSTKKGRFDGVYINQASITFPVEHTKFVCFMSSKRIYSPTPGNFLEVQLGPTKTGVWCRA